MIIDKPKINNMTIQTIHEKSTPHSIQRVFEKNNLTLNMNIKKYDELKIKLNHINPKKNSLVIYLHLGDSKPIILFFVFVLSLFTFVIYLSFYSIFKGKYSIK